MKQQASFSTSIIGYDSLLRSLAVHLTRKRDEIDDLIQETYYRALANQEKFTEGTNLKAWLSTIMRNIFINNYNRNSTRRVVSYQLDEPNMYFAPLTEKNSSFRTFISEDIQKAMKGVGADFTRPFLMYHEGFQYQEIAETLEIPLGTVKSRIFFARKELQQRLKEAGIESPATN